MRIGPQEKPGLPESVAAGPRPDSPIKPEAQAALARAGRVASAVAAADGATEVSLSSAARVVQSGVAGAADVDLNKVRQVQAALAQGTYRVSPEAIADELIASAQAFLPRPAGGSGG